NALLKEAYPLLEQSGLNFIGNLEGSDLVTGAADVFVCDGYAGNLMLKCTEAVGKAAQDAVKNSARAAGLNDAATQALLEPLRELFDLNGRGGATFLGTRKPIVKMHGCATARTVVACAEQMLAGV
ncbi:MAG: phosphate--acyl-ACP acyltransferase, partial [Clostridia bacterium]|nr:phosphate--acyl-ACP acyltransferase [Clostridia bacterium]